MRYSEQAAPVLTLTAGPVNCYPDVLRAQIQTLAKFTQTEATKAMPFGAMAEDDWKIAVGILASGGLVDANLAPAGLFTNDMIDKDVVASLAAGKF